MTSMASASSPKSALCKIGLYSKHKPLRVVVLGQCGVGKTALVVRFITRRFIGDYDPTLEKVYSFHTIMDDEMVYFDILDTAGQSTDTEFLSLEAKIRWGEAFIIMYSVTDKCSFDECNRLKFLINYNKRRRKRNSSKETVLEVPVVLVGNKSDQYDDRMVSQEDGQRRSKDIGCVCFHEISVRESIEQVWSAFHDVYRFWKVHTKFPKLKRSSSDFNSPDMPPLSNSFPSNNGRQSLSLLLGRRFTEVDAEEEEPKEEQEGLGEEGDTLPPFRGRASTDGHILSRPKKWYNSSQANTVHTVIRRQTDRRMSISMRGNNASY